MKNLSIGTRLGGGFALVLLLMALMTAFGVWRLQTVALATNDILTSVDELRRQGVQFLDTPDAYYEDPELRARIGEVKGLEAVEMREHEAPREVVVAFVYSPYDENARIERAEAGSKREHDLVSRREAEIRRVVLRDHYARGIRRKGAP